MKRLSLAFGWRFVLMFCLSAASLGAHNYDLAWFSIDGGGGASKSGTFSLVGTIGQPDAGRMSGTGFELEGGFWGFLPVDQAAGPPSLSITLTTANTVLLAWPSAASGFELQECSALELGSWVKLAIPPVVINGQDQVTISPATAKRFYRLVKP